MNYYKVTPSETGEYIRGAMRTSRYQIETKAFDTAEAAAADGYESHSSARQCMDCWDLSFLGAPEQVLYPTPQALDFSKDAGTKTIFVSTTEDSYTASRVESSETWCTVSQDEEIVSVAVTANDTASVRNATVALKAGTRIVNVPVTQEGTSA